jgi:hypothetical protein
MLSSWMARCTLEKATKGNVSRAANLLQGARTRRGVAGE